MPDFEQEQQHMAAEARYKEQKADLFKALKSAGHKPVTLSRQSRDEGRLSWIVRLWCMNCKKNWLGPLHYVAGLSPQRPCTHQESRITARLEPWLDRLTPDPTPDELPEEGYWTDLVPAAMLQLITDEIEEPQEGDLPIFGDRRDEAHLVNSHSDECLYYDGKVFRSTDGSIWFRPS